MTNYRETETQDAVNTALVAGSREVILTGTLRVQNYNTLTITNRDVVDIRVILDNSLAGIGQIGTIFDIPANSIMTITPEENIFFKTIEQINLDSLTTQTAGLIRLRASKSVVV